MVKKMNPSMTPHLCANTLYSLLREEVVFTNSGCYQWTTNKNADGFFSFTDAFTKQFGSDGDYKCLPTGHIAPNTRRTVELEFVLNFLKSQTDESEYEANRWLWEDGKKFHFLSGSSISGNRVAFNSFRRCGNSFMRKFISQISGLETGSSLGIHTGTIL